MNMKKNNYFTRGVYYDDEVIHAESECLVNDIERLRKILSDAHDNEIIPEIQKTADDTNTTYSDAEFVFNTLDTIATMVGYNTYTNKNDNMIIPKAYLSDDLIEALEPVDIGSDIMHKYVEVTYNNREDEYIDTTEPDADIPHINIYVPVNNGKPDFDKAIIEF